MDSTVEEQELHSAHSQGSPLTQLWKGEHCSAPILENIH